MPIKRLTPSSFSALPVLMVAGFWLGSCSTVETTPRAIPPSEPPEYVRVPHPAGYDLGDLLALFNQPGAPSKENRKDCDADFVAIRKTIQKDDDFKEGVAELVHRDPIPQHWCFYGKILDLENKLRTEAYVDDRQKIVLDTYAYLVPIAKGFLKSFHDSRYLRWAMHHYRSISPFVFFERVDQTPEMTKELVEVSNPFGLWREAPNQPGKETVLQRYHLGKQKAEEGSASGGSLIQKLTDTPPPSEAAAPPSPTPSAVPESTPSATTSTSTGAPAAEEPPPPPEAQPAEPKKP